MCNTLLATPSIRQNIKKNDKETPWQKGHYYASGIFNILKIKGPLNFDCKFIGVCPFQHIW